MNRMSGSVRFFPNEKPKNGYLTYDTQNRRILDRVI